MNHPTSIGQLLKCLLFVDEVTYLLMVTIFSFFFILLLFVLCNNIIFVLHISFSTFQIPAFSYFAHFLQNANIASSCLSKLVRTFIRRP